jgi:hypothetical protein
VLLHHWNGTRVVTHQSLIGSYGPSGRFSDPPPGGVRGLDLVGRVGVVAGEEEVPERVGGRDQRDPEP